MKTFALLIAFLIAGAAADGFHPAGRAGRGRAGRRLSGSRRFRAGRAFRRGRQDDLAAADAAPLEQYGAAVEAADAAFADYEEAPLDQYAGDAGAGALGDYDDSALGGAAGSGDANLDMLEKSVPGIPGQDYPIYSEVPETAFGCEGQVEGGYYADPEAECQVFHICTADGQGGLSKYSFLCPNGTIFNQNYFICDWWFNFDCAEAESLYSRNDEIRAEQEANIGAVSDEGAAGAGAGLSNYGAPQNNDIAAYDEVPAYDDVAAYDELPAEDIAAYDYAAADEAAPLDNYGAAPVDEAVPVFEESAAAAPAGSYGAPAAEEEERAARRFRGRAGRRNNRRNNRNGRSRSGRRLSSRRSNSRRAGRNSRRNGRRSGRNFSG